MAKQMNLFGGGKQPYMVPATFDYFADTNQKRLPITGQARHVPGQGGPVYSPGNPRKAPPNLALYKGGFNPNAPMPRSGVNPNPTPNLAVTKGAAKEAAKTLPKGAAQNILKSAGKMAMFGKLMGWGMVAMTAYMIMDQMGLTGKEGKADKETIAVLDVVGSQWAEKEKAGGQFLKARKGSEDMQQFAEFAQAKQRAKRDIGGVVGSELDALLGGKASLLSKASLAQPQTQQTIQSLGEYI